MSRLPRTLTVSLCIIALSTAASAHGEEKHAEEVTLGGEILDLHCYMLHPDTGRGPDHAKCANSCIDRGLPAGFLADGQVYVLLGPGHDSPKDMISGKAGTDVRLTGTIVDHGGMKAIQVTSVEAAGGSKARTKPAAKDAHEGHDH